MISDEALIEIAYKAFLTMAPDDGDEYEAYDDLDARQRDALGAMVGAVRAAVMHDAIVALRGIRTRACDDYDITASGAFHMAVRVGTIDDALLALGAVPDTGVDDSGEGEDADNRHDDAMGRHDREDGHKHGND